MEKYFSSTVCSKGYCTCFNRIYKNDPSAKVYIINGTDYEKSVFFKKIEKNFQGFRVACFNPFYDECTDGILIKNFNTYILSDGGYNKILPVFPGVWENLITISQKAADRETIALLSAGRQKENDLYFQACRHLKKAALVRERMHREMSPLLNESRVLRIITKICRIIRCRPNDEGSEIRLLSSPAPLGFKTHYDSVFSLCDRFISINDEAGLLSSIILGVIRNYALKNNIRVICSPQYFNNSFYNFLILPDAKIGLCTSDSCHILPFEADYIISSEDFFEVSKECEKKVTALLSVEESFLKKAILLLYEGREERFRYNNLIKGYEQPCKAKECADNLTEIILK